MQTEPCLLKAGIFPGVLATQIQCQGECIRMGTLSEFGLPSLTQAILIANLKKAGMA